MPKQQDESAEPFVDLILLAHENGDLESRNLLFASLYEELHHLAKRQLRQQGRWATLSATTLLHEVYLNLLKREVVPIGHRAIFLGYACRAMRGLVINYARSRQAIKRGGTFEIVPLPTDIPEHVTDSEQLARLGDAVERLAAVDPQLAEIIDLKYFGGFNFADIAAMRGMSERTVQRHWEKARLFLHRAMVDWEDTES